MTLLVMAGLRSGHPRLAWERKTWMAGTRPAMTAERSVQPYRKMVNSGHRLAWNAFEIMPRSVAASAGRQNSIDILNHFDGCSDHVRVLRPCRRFCLDVAS